MKDPKERKYKPSEVVTKISEQFGLIITPSVIRKYDYEILADFVEHREDHAKRLYSEEEVEYFLFIAVLRSLGFSLKYITEQLEILLKHHSDGLDTVNIISRIERQKVGFDKMYHFLSKKHEPKNQLNP